MCLLTLYKKVSKSNIFKLVEIFAGSTFIFTLVGYLCGYVIVMSFLKSLFNLPFVTGMLIPQSSVIFLGYILIISFLVSIPLVWNIGLHRNLSEISTLSMSFIILAIINKLNINMCVFNTPIPTFIPKIVLIFVSFIVYLVIKFRLKKIFTKNSKLKQRFFSYFPMSTVFIFLVGSKSPRKA